MHKLLLLVSCGYSALLMTVSLININNAVDLSHGNDKVIHAFAHVLFTSVWFLTFYYFYNKSKIEALKRAFIGSVVFGILIEILQQVLTESRQADYKDVIANVIGAVIAVFIINLLTLRKVKND
ncbi:VanZ family protein [Olleya sp. Bg11-27]|uniref:VanZ family protein n=1 Tax=Olleya sp. Bg11-27 TaxID=2058135 RepID=UPI001E5489F5|nr:VanZ family protein [Olleya sp. Bg11-27]